jgi:hypothetical protein
MLILIHDYGLRIAIGDVLTAAGYTPRLACTFEQALAMTEGRKPWLFILGWGPVIASSPTPVFLESWRRIAGNEVTPVLVVASSTRYRAMDCTDWMEMPSLEELLAAVRRRCPVAAGAVARL